MIKTYIIVSATLGLLIGALYSYVCKDLAIFSMFAAIDIIYIFIAAEIAKLTASDANETKNFNSYRSSHNMQ